MAATELQQAILDRLSTEALAKALAKAEAKRVAAENEIDLIETEIARRQERG